MTDFKFLLTEMVRESLSEIENGTPPKQELTQLIKHIEDFSDLLKHEINSSKFARLSDDELYIISRALIESSAIFVMGDEKGESRYSELEQQIHTQLLNTSLDERKTRNI